jgi:glycosyltransferase involved in cell wall biosynthesis
MATCDKWQSQCFRCVQKREYSFFFDKSEKIFERKKRLFEGLDFTIITPSRWLSDIVRRSFFKEYPVEVINNGIDLEIFKPQENDFRQRYGLENKKIILGVSFEWDERKGLDAFIGLSQSLSDEYKIVLVGTDDNVDKHLPKNVLSIHRTQNQKELAAIYSAADVLVNPTREDNFPTVNMESIACGLPLITFKTGGSIEIFDEGSGLMVDKDDIDGMERAIRQVRKDGGLSREECILRSKKYDQNERFTEYVDLIQSML